MFKGKIGRVIKKDINMNNKVIIFTVFMCVLTIGLYYSYALFQMNVIKNDIVKIETGTLNVVLTSNDLVNNKTIMIPGSGSVTVNLKITNKTIINAKYVLYTNDAINGIVFSSPTNFDDYDYYFEGVLLGNDSADYVLTIRNINESNVTINFDILAGLDSYGVEVENDSNVIPLSPSYIMVGTDGNSTTSFLGGPITKTSIENITFVNNNVVPSDAIGSFDVSEDKNKSVMAWYKNGSSGMYQIYIGGSNGGVLSNPDSSNLFSYLDNLTTIDFINFRVTEATTNMYGMFQGATKITNMDLSEWNTSGLTDLRNTFRTMTSLESLNLANWDVSNVENMYGLFHSAINLTNLDLTGWVSSSKLINTANMFAVNAKITTLNLAGWDISSVTSMSYMFHGMNSLKNLDLTGWEPSSELTNISYMFYRVSSIENLDLSGWNTSGITNLSSAFRGMTALKTLNLADWNVSNVTTMFDLFCENVNLTNLILTGWKSSSKLTDMNGMFNGASKLTSINLTGWDTSGVTNMRYTFAGTNLLTSLDISSFVFTSLTIYSDMFIGSNANLKVYVKDTTAYNIIKPILINTTQQSLLTIKS